MVRCRQNESGYWDAFKICLWISMWCPLCENSLSCPFMIIIICTTPIKVYDIKEKELLIPSLSLTGTDWGWAEKHGWGSVEKSPPQITIISVWMFFLASEHHSSSLTPLMMPMPPTEILGCLHSYSATPDPSSFPSILTTTPEFMHKGTWWARGSEVSRGKPWGRLGLHLPSEANHFCWTKRQLLQALFPLTTSSPLPAQPSVKVLQMCPHKLSMFQSYSAHRSVGVCFYIDSCGYYQTFIYTDSFASTHS